jgi:hypothetical protein
VRRVFPILAVLGSSASGSPKPPHGATKISIDYDYTGWSRAQERHVIEWTERGYVTRDGKAVDAKLVDDLYASLTDLRDSTQSLRCLSRTDDYPKFKVVVESATEPVVLESDSNCSQHRPWNVQKAGKRLIQFTGNAWRGVGALLAAVNKEWEKKRLRNLRGGIEMIHVGEYPRSSGEPTACAKSFAANPQLRTMFGDPLTVDELGLICDLNESADCTAMQARATFKWLGVTAHVDVSCSKGKVTLPPKLADSQRALATFVASKPVRALVKTSPEAPRLSGHGRSWNLQVVEPGLPTLSWTEGQTTIDLRVVIALGAPDPKFWKELGIEVARLPRRDGVIDVKLDFAGKLVR